jgi:hypothetical protein
VRPSEFASTASGSIYLGVVVEAASGSTLLAGHPRLSTGYFRSPAVPSGGKSFALFALTQAEGATNGRRAAPAAHRRCRRDDLRGLRCACSSWRVTPTADGTVDGSATREVVAQARGKQAGEAGYVAAADANRDGVIDATDNQLLFQNIGYAPNRPPVITPHLVKTHEDLEVSVSVGDFIVDPEGDQNFIQTGGASHGTASRHGDQFVLFSPELGYTGSAIFELGVDDGYSGASLADVGVHVSDARLVRIDLVDRTPLLDVGGSTKLTFIGDFEDQLQVRLPTSYLSLSSTNTVAAEIGPTGVLQAHHEGTGIVLAARDGLTAATAFSVGIPRDFVGSYLFFIGLDAYPDAITLALQHGSRQIRLGTLDDVDLSTAASGARYFVGDSAIATVTPDGIVIGVGTGRTAVTVVHGAAEQVIPITVGSSEIGVSQIDAHGGIVQAQDGSLLMVAPGSFDESAQVAFETETEGGLSLAVPIPFDFAAAFRIQTSAKSFALPAQVAVRVDAGFAPGTEVFFFRKSSVPTESGNDQDLWVLADNGVVGEDGYARTASPPYPGLIADGEFLVVRAKTPLRVLFDYKEPAAVLAIAAGLTIGTPFGLVLAAGAAIALPVSEVVESLIFRAYRPTGITVSQSNFNAALGTQVMKVPVPVVSPPALTGVPSVSTWSIDRTGNKAEIALEGVFGEVQDSIVVRIWNGPGKTRDILPVRVAGNSSLVTKLLLEIPNDFVVGLTELSVVRRPQSIKLGLLGQPTPGQESVLVSPSVRIYPIPSEVSFIAVAPGMVRVVENTANGLVVVADIDLGTGTLRGGVAPILATKDKSRVYVALETGGVAVIDAVARRIVDASPDDPIGKFIDRDPLGNVLPAFTTLAVDPANALLYAAGRHSQIYIIDIQPNSPNFDQVVGSIELGQDSAPVGVKGLAVSTDGRRLYGTAPRTTLTTIAASNIRGWYDEGREPGTIIVVNVDPEDEPIDDYSNALRWREVISRISARKEGASSGGIYPLSILATLDPHKLAFTNFLDVNNGLAVLEVMRDDPLQFEAKVSPISMNMDFPDPQRPIKFPALGPLLDLDITNARGLAITPNMSYAFVADWNIDGFPLDPNSEAYKRIYSEKLIEYGSKIGVVNNPFGNPEFGETKYLGATTPIPRAFADSLTFSADGKKLYAGHWGSQGVLVFNVEQLIKSAQKPIPPEAEKEPNESPYRFGDRRQTPLDKLDFEDGRSDGIQDYKINLSPISTGGAPIGVVTFDKSFIELIAPLTFSESDNTPLFEWRSSGGVTLVDSRVFVSTREAGVGLFPDDFGARYDYDNNESMVGLLMDFNENRIVNGMWVQGTGVAGDGFKYRLSNERQLTRGQTYYWGVIGKAEDGSLSRASGSFKLAPVTINAPDSYSTVVLLTHGFELPILPLIDSSTNIIDDFVALANLIVDNFGGAIRIQNPATGEWDLIRGSNSLEPGKPIVLISNWIKESGISDSGFSEAAADATFANVISLNEELSGALFRSPWHLIGHSRGASVNSEIAQRLGTYYNGIPSVQMTTLDPHDQIQQSLDIPLGEILGVAWQPLAKAAVLAGLGTIRYADFKDPNVVIWENIGLADNYYQEMSGREPFGRVWNLTRKSASALSSFGLGGSAAVVLAKFPKYYSFTPNGRVIDGADINLNLSVRPGFFADDFGIGVGGPHSLVKSWYAGTMDLGLRQFQSDTINRLPGLLEGFVPWYRGRETEVLPAGNWLTYFDPLPPALDGTSVVPSLHPIAAAFAGDQAPWEGIGAGWFYSLLGGGEVIQLSPVVNPGGVARVTLDTNNTEFGDRREPVPSVFNGDFQASIRPFIGRLPLTTWLEIPGWSMQGGSGGYLQGAGLRPRFDQNRFEEFFLDLAREFPGYEWESAKEFFLDVGKKYVTNLVKVWEAADELGGNDAERVLQLKELWTLGMEQLNLGWQNSVAQLKSLPFDILLQRAGVENPSTEGAIASVLGSTKTSGVALSFLKTFVGKLPELVVKAVEIIQAKFIDFSFALSSGEVLTHNWLLLPSDKEVLQFDLEVSDFKDDAVLTAFIVTANAAPGNVHFIGSVELSQLPADSARSVSLAIPADLRGMVGKLSFRVSGVKQGVGLPREVVVTVDNVHLSSALEAEEVETVNGFGLNDALVFKGEGETGGVLAAISVSEADVNLLKGQVAAAFGVDGARLEDVSFVFRDLPEAVLATVSADSEGGLICLLDLDASGFGWFVDPTPWANEEFSWDATVGEWVAEGESPAAGHIDLLTVLSHEFGHVLGLRHTASAGGTSGIMLSPLSPGVRRTPIDAERAAVTHGVAAGIDTETSASMSVEYFIGESGRLPLSGVEVGVSSLGGLEPELLSESEPVLGEGVINGNFVVWEINADNFGWTFAGAAAVSEGRAALFEDGTAFSRLAQSFIIPEGIAALRFTLPAVKMETGTGGVARDAFEVALLDVMTLEPVTALEGGLSFSDALLSVQSDGRAYYGSDVQLTGATSSGEAIDLAGPIIVEVDLTGVAAGRGVTLYFDLLGFGDLDSKVTIDAVELIYGGNTAPHAIDDLVSLDEDASPIVRRPHQRHRRPERPAHRRASVDPNPRHPDRPARRHLPVPACRQLQRRGQLYLPPERR